MSGGTISTCSGTKWIDLFESFSPIPASACEPFVRPSTHLYIAIPSTPAYSHTIFMVYSWPPVVADTEPKKIQCIVATMDTMRLTFGIVREKKKKNHIDDADSFRTKQIVRSNENISVCYRDRDSSCRSIAYVTANYQTAEDIDLCAFLLISAMNGVTAKVSFFTIWMVK